MKKQQRGFFIVLEGLDRSGKSTQVKKTREYFESLNLPVKCLEFPDRTTATGKLIDLYLKKKLSLNDQTIHLLYTTNRWEKKEEIEALLNNGVNIICSRYSYSGLAYTGAKKVLNLEWCEMPEIGLPSPDLVLYIKVSLNLSQTRGGFGAEKYDLVSFQSKVNSVFSKIIELDQEKGYNIFKVINGNNKMEKVQEDIQKQIRVLFEKKINLMKVKKLKPLFIDSKEKEMYENRRRLRKWRKKTLVLVAFIGGYFILNILRKLFSLGL